MKKVMAVAVWILLSVFLILPVNAGPGDNSGGTQQSEKSSQSAPKKAKLSKRNQAKIEQAEQAEMRRDNIMKARAAEENNAGNTHQQ